MPARKYLARDHTFWVSTNNRASWVPVSGISTWTWAMESNDEDVTTLDSRGWKNTMYTQRGGSVSIEGFILVDSSNNARDTGQNTIDIYAARVGYDAYLDFKIAAQKTVSGVLGAEIGSIIFTGSPAPKDIGGTTTDVAPWGVDIGMDGYPVGSGMYAFLNG